ncbi:DNA replication complex GINS protein PSF1 [Thecamonas trahens ATCC 50062]|uniref:DNA replication complex GINS protein PSF1 n=1 Tax=Thecamonas trahens ATCC 50062 TaxID=461836 RepID=A0A0L0DI46_THETB|nr:DNA replication complex GINS protein PSF1 [Thecamonas trahens ATCC 50062]KNC51977.1 DNA replication complex GINS protein PSF1 [Thecamonas trahens ATCC 50062]|eukprot:XP_013755563.1 DNA replication complex GINS protein PSF1 [Thecamonas trahens ATCC 50062]
MAMYGADALEVLKELSTATRLPVYRAKSVSKAVDEVIHLHAEVLAILRERPEAARNDASVTASVIFHHAALLRNKRIMLAYHYHRMQYLQNLRWEVGAILPPDVREATSALETGFFSAYDRLLGDYMTEVDLNLTEDLTPPKDLFIEVRVVQDAGTIITEAGDELTLTRNSTHYLRRSDVEHLIRQGVVEHIVH